MKSEMFLGVGVCRIHGSSGRNVILDLVIVLSSYELVWHE